MPVCYMNANYDKRYKCEYNIKTDFIEVKLEYYIGDEIEAVNGVKSHRINTEFKLRDILIVDNQNKKNFLLKDSYCVRYSSISGTPDGGTRTVFQALNYFEHYNLEKLEELLSTPKVNKIKVFSSAINKLIGCPSLQIESSESEYIIKLARKNLKGDIEINSNGIKKISVSDCWKEPQNSEEYNINIDISGYIEIELTYRVNYDLVPDFVNELMIFMQLYFSDKFLVDMICVMVNEEYYNLFTPIMKLNYTDKYIKKTVNDELLVFLSKCYTAIPYRKSKTEIRNIPYIVMKTSRNVEDNFLMFYRFIECYYKTQKIYNIRKTFISYSIKEHYAQENYLTEEQIEYFSQEIISLRNHYVHAGYYIKNSSLRIKFEKIDKRDNPKNYTKDNVDVNWIYYRTEILYIIAVDIIFRKMLEYEEYQFNRDFNVLE